MKKILSLLITLIVGFSIYAQSPASFRYQALLRNTDGTVKTNAAVALKIDILKGSENGTSVYTESHNITTTSAGVINVDLGSGTPSNGIFSAIDWSTGVYFMKITVDGILMGTSQLLSVPYALYSTKAGNGFSGNYADLTNEPDLTVGAVKKLTVTGETTNMEEILFEVKNLTGQTVFAVYNEGVRVYIANGDAKGSKGGFSIGGFTSGKAPSQDYLVVNPDSIRMYIDATPGKSAKGGFALGGFTASKSSLQNLLIVNSDSIRAYIDSNTGKGSKGGFAIGGFNQGKGPGDEYLRVTHDSTRIYINNTPSKSAKGGFAIGGFSGSKGLSNNYMFIDTDSTNFYVQSLNPNTSSTFNILSVDENQKHKSLLKANFDTIDLATVLNVQNNFNVYGNIDYTGTVSQIVVPEISTNSIINITQTTAGSGGNISSNGGAPVISSGVVWSLTPNPTVALTTKTSDGSATGSFTSSITGLTANTTYYVRAYATNSIGTAYGNEVSFTTANTGSGIVFNLSLTYGSLSDIDGNTYKTIQIGTQTWMAENLKTTKYRDGSSISNITDNTSWSNLTSGAYCWFDNDQATYKDTYGAWYNYYATVDNRNLCPTGWHVPNDAEWSTLTTYLGGSNIAGGKLKETGLSHWLSPNVGATNESGFTSLPGGYRNFDGTFGSSGGGTAAFWGSTEYTAANAGSKIMYYYDSKTNNNYALKVEGCNVRCLKDVELTLPVLTTISATSITQTTAVSGGNITNDGGAPLLSRGVCWNTSPSPLLANPHTSDGTSVGTFVSSLSGLSANTTYYVRAYASNSAGVAYGNEISFTTSSAIGSVTDFDGNIYGTVVIGTQTWMSENLKTTSFSDGTPIPNVTDGPSWSYLSTPAYVWYNNDAATYKASYGALYNWFTLYPTTNGGKNVCPTGWHVPTDDEWNTLTAYLGGFIGAGGKLKETGLTHWNSPNIGATNETGFTALPGGMCNFSGIFSGILINTLIWSASEADSQSGWTRNMFTSGADVVKGMANKTYGLSVRCLQGNPVAVLPSIITIPGSDITSTTATSGGDIMSDGGAAVTAKGICWSTTANPTTADSKTSDGTGTGPFVSSITGLTAGTTYHARAYATNSSGTAYGNDISFFTSPLTGSVTDYDGNTYSTVTIGTQTWMAENLKTTSFSDGTAIPNVTDGPTWLISNAPAYTWYNNDASTNKITYGALYNWFTLDAASNGSKNVCPIGWHVPTDGEWTTLTTFLGGEPVAGGKLKETGLTHWSFANVGATNETGFTALPGGFLNNGSFSFNGSSGYWWCSTDASPLSTWTRSMYNSQANVARSNENKVNGFSIRCVQGAALPDVPILFTTPASSITETTALSGSDVMSDGGAPVTDRGVCWSTASNPTIADFTISGGTGTGPLPASLTGLTAGTTYYVRAYATNSAGTAYGNEISFTTNTVGATVATLTTNAVVGISFDFAASGGNITSDGGAQVTERGVVWSTNPGPTIADNKTFDGIGIGIYPSQMTALIPATTYYVRAYATNSIGTAYGDELSFTTTVSK